MDKISLKTAGIRRFACVLAAVLVCVFAPAAAETFVTAEGYVYEIEEDALGVKTAVINDYIGDSDEVEVPGFCGGLLVTEVEAGTFDRRKDTLTSVVWTSVLDEMPAKMFYGYPALESVFLPEGVKTIAGTSKFTEGAFGDCDALVSVTLPTTLEEIGYAAFRDCDALKTINIPDKTATLSGSVFESCDSLETVNLGSGVKYIGSWAFMDCTKLDGVVFPDGLETIEGSAFKNTGLTKIALPDTVTTIGFQAFQDLQDTLVYLRWSAGVPVVASYNFMNCTELETIILPEGVIEVGGEDQYTEGAFYNCDAIESVTLPATLERLAYGAFMDCDSLVTVRFLDNSDPEHAVNIAGSAFQTCDNLERVYFNSSLRYIGSWAFMDCTKLDGVVFPEGLETIEGGAFKNTGLTSVSLPDTVTAVGFQAFQDLQDTLVYLRWTAGIPVVPTYNFTNSTVLKTIVLPEGVTEIGGEDQWTEGAFGNCDALESITFPSTMTTLQYGAFWDCDVLTTVTFTNNSDPDHAVVIGAMAFQTCDLLESVTLNGSVIQIGNSAFTDCPLLTGVEFPEGLTTIGSSAFKNTGLTSISLPDTVTSVGSQAFNGLQDTLTYLRWSGGTPVVPYGHFGDCTLLETVILPEGVTACESPTRYTEGAFAGCTSLVNLSLPKTLKDVGYGAFRGCTALTSVIIPDNDDPAYPLNVSSRAFDLCNNIDTVDFGNRTVSVGNMAFSSPKLTKITLPDSVTSVDAKAFSGNEGTMTYFKWPAGTTTIPGGMFMDCTALETIIIPEGVTAIDHGAAYSSGTFHGCTALKEINLPSTMKTIGNFAFTDCALLDNVTLPDGLTTLGADAFRNCDSLTSIAIPDQVTTIIQYTFQGCAKLSEVTIGKGVVDIGRYAFCDTALERVEIPDTVTTIGTNAFGNLQNTLTYLRWTGGVPTVPAGAFADCASLATVILPEGVTAIDHGATYSSGTFHGCTALKEIALPSTMKSIGNFAFTDCSALKTVTMQEGLTDICADAFRNCDSLTQIRIPNTVTTIIQYAFQGCDNLTDVNIPFALTVLAKYTFSGTKVAEVELPVGLTSIDATAFPAAVHLRCAEDTPTAGALKAAGYANVTLLKGLKLPSSLTAIKKEAFSNLPAGYVVIPEGCKTIGAKAFKGMENLRYVWVPASVTSIAADAFDGCEIFEFIVAEGSAAQTFAQSNELPVFVQ